MINHPDIMWRYAETLSRQAELDCRTCYTPPIMSALSIPRPAGRFQRIFGFRKQ